MIPRPVRPLLLSAAFALGACTDVTSVTAPATAAAAPGTTNCVVLLGNTTTDAAVVLSRLTQSLPSFRVSDRLNFPAQRSSQIPHPHRGSWVMNSRLDGRRA